MGKRSALIFAVDNFPQHKRDLVPSYKMNRTRLAEGDDPRPILKILFSSTNSYFAETPAQEADDTIASLVPKYADKEIIIISSDHDLLQLNRFSHVNVFSLTKGEFLGKDFLKEKFGLNKWSKIPLYKAAFGDSSDNVKPALPRVRKNTILPVLNKCEPKLKSFIVAFEKSEQSEKTKKVFAENKHNLKLNYSIVKLNTKLQVVLKRNKINKKEALKLCDLYQINVSLITNFDVLF